MVVVVVGGGGGGGGPGHCVLSNPTTRKSKGSNREQKELGLCTFNRCGHDSSSSNACDSLTPYSVKSTCPLKLLCDDLIID